MSGLVFIQKYKKSFYRVLQVSALAVFVCYFLIWSLSPFVVRHYLAEFLAGHNLELSGRSVIRYNPFVSDLVIRDVIFLQEGDVVLSIDKADIEIDAYRLLMDNIHIKKFSIEKIDITVDITDKSLVVAGFELPNERHTDVVRDGSESNDFPFTITAPDLSMLKSSVNVNHHGIPHSLLIKELSVHDVSVTEQRQQLELDAVLSLMQGELVLSSTLDVVLGKGKVLSRVSLKKLELDKIASELSDHVRTLAGKLSLSINPVVDFDSKNVSLKLEDSTVSIQEFSGEIDQLTGTFDEFKMSLAEVTLQIGDGGVFDLLSRGELAINGVRVKNPANDATYLQWESLLLSSLEFSADQNYLESARIDIGRIALDELVGSHIGGEDDLPPLLGVGTVLVEDVTYAGRSLSISDIGLSNIAGHVLIAKDGSLVTLMNASMSALSDDGADENLVNDKGMDTGKEKGTSKEKAEKEGEPEQQSALKITLNKVSVSGDNQIHFHDKSVTPNYDRVIYLDTVEISEINSDSASLSPFRVEGRSNEYTKFQFSGGVAPFSGVSNLALKGSVNELSLPAVSSYIKDSLGFELKNGQLAAKLDVRVTNSKLDGKIKLDLRGLDMTAANDDGVGTLKDQTLIPLNVALGMLKDKRGNIKLNVPVSGSVDDPSFGVSSLFLLITKQAVISQAKSYLMQTFVPYASVVSVVISAGEFALKLRFEDLEFKPKAVEIADDQKVYIDQFIKLMKDKEKTEVKVCGIATPEDIGLDAGSKISNDELLNNLKDVAKFRSENFKRYAVEIGGLDSSRLLLCNPEIDFSKKAKPRISISL